MILIIIVTGFALLILLFGFLGIKIPFVNGRNSKQKKRSSSKQAVRIDENLVKNSVDETVKTTRFLKKTTSHNSFSENGTNAA